MVRKMRAKGANIQVKSLIDFKKTWRTADQDLFKRLKESLSPCKQNIKKWNVGQDYLNQSIHLSVLCHVFLCLDTSTQKMTDTKRKKNLLYFCLLSFFEGHSQLVSVFWVRENYSQLWWDNLWWMDGVEIHYRRVSLPLKYQNAHRTNLTG